MQEKPESLDKVTKKIDIIGSYMLYSAIRLMQDQNESILNSMVMFKLFSGGRIALQCPFVRPCPNL